MSGDKEFAKWFEGQVHDLGQELQTKQPIFWHRFPDAYAARSALPAQPGDFMLVSNFTWLIEVKTSVKHKSLTACAASLIEENQAAKHVLWNRTPQLSVFIFMSEVSDQVEVWNGSYVAEQRSVGLRLRGSEGLLLEASFSQPNLYSFLYKMHKSKGGSL